MMDFNIIDAHSHLWLRQDTEVNGLPIRTLTNGRSLFIFPLYYIKIHLKLYKK